MYLLLLVDDRATKLLEQIANNTKYDWFPGFVMSIFALIFSFISVRFTIRTYNSQKETERNTGLLNMSEQRRLLVEMVRHLYRNMVVSYSIEVKMRAKDFTVYPSEEHLQKMKVELTDIHLNLFYRSDKEHQDMNKLYMELRNYNTELDIICDHFRNPDIDPITKERDLRTLCFKCNHLTKRITKVISLIWKEEPANRAYEEVRNIINKEIEEKNSMPGHVYTESFTLYQNKESFYAKELFANDPIRFFDGFNENVRHECGLNDEDAEKIHMIALHKE